MVVSLTDTRLAEIRAKMRRWKIEPATIMIYGEMRREAPPIIAELLAEVERLRAAERGKS